MDKIENNTQSPQLSIIMSVFNEEKSIRKSMDSIINQTFQDFELIIIDDASTDTTLNILSHYKDVRIRLYRNKMNRGLTRNLNSALRLARGKYIGRTDGDDVLYPERFEKQINFLENNPNIMLVSCGIRYWGNRSGVYIPTDKFDHIKIKLLFNSVLPHPGFLFRRELYTQEKIMYNAKFKYSQDYDFQYRVSKKYMISNIPEVLIRYNCSNRQISQKHFKEQSAYANQVRCSQLRGMNLKINKHRMKVIQLFAEGQYIGLNIIDLISLVIILKKIYKYISMNEENLVLYLREEFNERFGHMITCFKNAIVKKYILMASKIYKNVK